MGMNKSAWKVICDSGPIIHLDELNCLHLLADFQETLIPDTIQREINRHRRLDFGRLHIRFVVLPGAIPSNDLLLALCKIFLLDAGEIMVKNSGSNLTHLSSQIMKSLKDGGFLLANE